MSPLPAQSAVGTDGSAPAYVLALDIGGTKLAAGVVDRSGQVHSFALASTFADEGPERGLERLFELGRTAVSESGRDWSEIGAVGIGCGGPLDAAGGVLIAPPHLAGWRDVPVTALAERVFGLPAALENDATAAAAAEHRYGAGVGARNMIYLTISTGVGGGIVLEGKLYRGATGNGGELGHVTVDCGGRTCRGCGRRGCLEAYVSGTSIAERAHEALADPAESSSLAGLGETLTAGDVAAAAGAGDGVAVAVWEETLDALACGLTSIVNVFAPEIVVLGGGVVFGTGEQLLGPVRKRVRVEAMQPAGESVEILQSVLGEHVGVVGAAAITYERELAGTILTHG